MIHFNAAVNADINNVHAAALAAVQHKFDEADVLTKKAAKLEKQALKMKCSVVDPEFIRIRKEVSNLRLSAKNLCIEAQTYIDSKIWY